MLVPYDLSNAKVMAVRWLFSSLCLLALRYSSHFGLAHDTHNERNQNTLLLAPASVSFVLGEPFQKFLKSLLFLFWERAHKRLITDPGLLKSIKAIITRRNGNPSSNSRKLLQCCICNCYVWILGKMDMVFSVGVHDHQAPINRCLLVSMFRSGLWVDYRVLGLQWRFESLDWRMVHVARDGRE